MKYEDWIRYEQLRKNKATTFEWVSLPEQIAPPEVQIPIKTRSLQKPQRETRFSQILRSLHL